MTNIELRQIIADIDLKRAETQKAYMDMRFVPITLAVTAMGAGAAILAAFEGYLKLVGGW